MKHLLRYKLFEKSSLNYLGVPNDVMVDIQKQFALSDDAEWSPLKYKKDLQTQLRRGEDKFFVTISEDSVIIIFSVDDKFYVDNYKFYKADDMGDEYWDKDDRTESDVIEINRYVPRGAKIYKLTSGDWTYENQANRKSNKHSEHFENFTIQFKKDFAVNFTKVVKKLFSNRAFFIQDMIIHNLINVNNNISPEDAKEMLALNVDDAKKSKFFKTRGDEQDPFKLQIKYIRDNSLTIFDEFLITFENEISQEYNEFLNIEMLCNKYGRDKIMLSFAYYLYSGKIMNL